ncbi:MAG: hypothetical protein CK425_11210 [Parachlamydia sp.]|nr:MAG: hypothetical protein CK425_11210 [Parachlamydia sp.]
MKKFSVFLLSLIVSFCDVHATLYCDLDTTSLIKCTFSAKHHNRIILNRGSIIKVIFSETDVSIRLEEESGQVFIQSLAFKPWPTTLSVITDEGLVQDIEINFTDQSSEILILSIPEECDKMCDIECAFNQDIASTLEDILKGRAPAGYKSFEMDCASQAVKNGVSAKKKAKFVGSSNTLYFWEIQNHSCFKKTISECELATEGTLWVYLAKNLLRRNEKTFAITAQDNHE